MPHWGNADFRLEIDEVFGNENTLDLGANISVVRKFLIRQAERQDVPFEPIPYALANVIFCDYIMQFEANYHDLPFKQIRFTEAPDGIGEIFNAEVTYSWDLQKNTDGEQEFTLPTFSLMGGKKKQFYPVITYDEDGKAVNSVKRYIKSSANKEAAKKVRKAQENLEAAEERARAAAGTSDEEAAKTAVAAARVARDLLLAAMEYVEDEKPIEYKMFGWDGKKFNGVEIEAPELKFMVPAWYPAEAMSPVFFKRLSKFVGTVNGEPFYGQDPGECMYLGPEQSWVTRTIETDDHENPVRLLRVMELQHHFHVQHDEEFVEIGDIVVPKIPGWDNVDIHYEESLVDIGDGRKTPLLVPKQVDVAPVKKRKDFWELFNGDILEGLWEGPLV